MKAKTKELGLTGKPICLINDNEMLIAELLELSNYKGDRYVERI